MTTLEQNGKRYASLSALQARQAMTPRELVEDAIRRMTDGTLTFRLDENDHTVAAGFMLDGHVHGYAWSKESLAYDCLAADAGLRELLRDANRGVTA